MENCLNLLLIDGDMIAYKKAAAAEVAVEWDPGDVSYHADLDGALAKAKDFIQEVKEKLRGDDLILAFSDTDNFRKKILPSYKSNRKDKHKPVLLAALKDHLSSHYEIKVKPWLEADDVLGILATRPLSVTNADHVIVAEDKDMLQIPGSIYNPRRGTTDHIPQGAADWWHMMQALMGDPSDGYKGLPGIGEVRASKILGKAEADGGTMWDGVVAAFKAKGLTEADALVQAQVSRICRYQDYDFEKKEPIRWMPPKPTGRSNKTVTEMPS